MKRIFTLCMLAAAMTVSVNARQLWSGSCTFSNYSVETGERPVIGASEFADAAVGDKLVINLTNYASDPQSWHQVELYNPDITKALLKGIQVTPGMTEAVFPIDASLLTALRGEGFALAGTGYTVTSIDLMDFDGVIWQGECTVMNWQASPAVNIAGSGFAAAKVGDRLVFSVEIINPDNWAGIQVDNSRYTASSFGSTEITAETTEVSFLLTSALLIELQRDGINITGENFVLTRIALEDPSAGIVSVGAETNTVSASVYTLTGIKVADSVDSVSSLRPGIYVSAGKKFVVR